MVKKSEKKVHKDAVSLECILACIYFVCLPFTVVTTPFGSLLKLITLPIAAVLTIRMLIGKSALALNYIHFTYAIYILYTVILLVVYHAPITIVTTKDMVLGLFMLMVISMRIYNNREKEWMESAWIIVGITCIVIALSSNEVVSRSEQRAVIRVLGFEEDQNHFCAYFIMPVLISVKRFMEKRRFYPVYILIIILSFYAILKTGSRGGLIGVLAGLLVYVLFGIKDIRARIAVITASILVAITVVTVVVPNLPEDVRQRYSITAVQEDRGSGRFEIWSYLLDYTLRSPQRTIRGSGIDSTYEILRDGGFRNGVAHNAYIQIFNDEGVIGLLLFCIVLAVCFIRNARRQPLYTCAFISLMAFSMSLTFYVFKPYLNIMMLCAMTFEETLPENHLKAVLRGEQNNV